MKRLIAAFAFWTLAACAPNAVDAPIEEQWRAIQLTATPVSFAAERVGRLRFRGGLDLSSPDDAFGGLSGLEVLDGNRLVAIGDGGDWFEGRLVLDASGALVGVADMRTAMMRDERGRPFTTKETGDSEDLAQLPDGRFAVSFEQTQTIRIYDINRDGPFGAAQRGPSLDQVRQLPRNVGLEALTATTDGALLVGAEGGDAPTTPLWVTPIGATRPAEPFGRYPLSGGFALTSLDRLPDGGGYVALERFYAPVIGARARITRFSAEALHAGATVAKEELALLEPPMPVDNFEGVSAVRMPDGATRLYILSDNNYSPRQRTLLLAFDIVDEPHS